MNNILEPENNIRKFMLEKPFTKSSLAREADVTTKTIDRMLSRQRTRIDSKIKVSRALGRELSEVFPFIDEQGVTNE